jgi:excisionase family DNA binding protein
MATATKPFLTVEDLAEMFYVTKDTIREWKRDGRLPAPLKVGKRLLWRAEQLAEILAGPVKRQG